MRTMILMLMASILALGTQAQVSYELKQKQEVEWTFLNPARGDKAPMAGTLWGDRNSTEPTGFLLKPKDGFESPPHIHNVSYRGVVISGEIHNDDANAADMWMGTGSFWTQPKGHVHITSAKGNNTLAYIEIDEGPYLVHSPDEAFHTHERPVNVDETNIVWLGAEDLKWIDQPGSKGADKAAKVAFLWGKPGAGELNGTLVKLPAGFKGKIKSRGTVLRAVVINGDLHYNNPENKANAKLETGSYFGSKGGGLHEVKTKEEVLLYVRSKGKFEVIAD